jgi:hypothetical protein
MTPKKTDRFPHGTCNKPGSADTILLSICDGTPGVANRITPIERISTRVLREAEIDDMSDQQHLIDNDTDDREINEQENNDVDLRAPLQLNILLADVVEQEQATVE